MFKDDYFFGAWMVRSDHTNVNDDDGSWNRKIVFNRGVKKNEVEKFLVENSMHGYSGRPGQPFSSPIIIHSPTKISPHFEVYQY